MAHAAGDAHEFPIYGAHYRVLFPILDSDGDLVTGATGLDSEVSIDGGTFGDCTNEATEIATNSGMYALYLTGAEMSGKAIAILVKTTTVGAKTTPIVLYPKRLSVLESGVAQAGAAGTITLAAGASGVDNAYNGCYVLITDNDAAGSQYQARRILSYVGSTKVATIESNWGTNPTSSSNYDILVPESVSVVAWLGSKVSDPTNAGVPNVNTKTWNDLATVELPLVPTTAGRKLDVSAGGEAGLDWANIGGPTTAQDLSGTTIKTATEVEADTQNIQSRLPTALTANGNLKASLVEILTTALTETAGQLAGGFKKWFNVATPTGTVNSLPDAVPGAASGVLIAGTNAPVTITGSGHALKLISTGAGGSALLALGEGGGSGITAIGGDTGSGVYAGAGDAGDAGIEASGGSGVAGHGIWAYGGDNGGNGIRAESFVDGDGIQAIGNGAGIDIRGELSALTETTHAEPTGVPAATATLAAKLNRVYQALRNGLTVTATAKTFQDDALAPLWKKPLSDDGTTYTEGEGTAP